MGGAKLGNMLVLRLQLESDLGRELETGLGNLFLELDLVLRLFVSCFLVVLSIHLQIRIFPRLKLAPAGFRNNHSYLIGRSNLKLRLLLW